MSVLYILVPLAVGLAGAALVGFFWAAHRGQFDDVETPALRILFDDEGSYAASTSPKSASKS